MNDTWQRGIILGSDAKPISPIVKVGGSLLTTPEWPRALAGLLEQISTPLLVVGGGAVVNGLRSIDAVNRRPADIMHSLAIDAMTLTASIVADALALPLVTSAAIEIPGVLDVAAWIVHEGRSGLIPASWDVTSDSLAAIAAGVSKRPLVLVKSVPPPATAATVQSLADAGWVDAWFPVAVGGVGAVSWIAPQA